MPQSMRSQRVKHDLATEQQKGLQIFQIVIVFFFLTTLISITIHLVRKVCQCIEAVKFRVVGKTFSKFYLLLESSNLALGKQLFSLKWQAHQDHYQENVHQVPK